MDKKYILNGKFSYKVLPDGSLDRTKVICIYCRGEFTYHRSTTSLKYHLSAKHTADAESPAPPRMKQKPLLFIGWLIIWVMFCNTPHYFMHTLFI